MEKQQGTTATLLDGLGNPLSDVHTTPTGTLEPSAEACQADSCCRTKKPNSEDNMVLDSVEQALKMHEAALQEAGDVYAAVSEREAPIIDLLERIKGLCRGYDTTLAVKSDGSSIAKIFEFTVTASGCSREKVVREELTGVLWKYYLMLRDA